MYSMENHFSFICYFRYTLKTLFYISFSWFFRPTLRMLGQLLRGHIVS
jgi:hypothetical protein